MRDAFFKELEQVFQKDDTAVFLTGDLGYKLFDPLKKVDEKRVFNVGIREAAMVGFAAGLARKGYRPFIYSITPFITLRCLEHIKIDLCYNKNQVVVVGVGGGYAYGPNGPTHFGLEDVGIFNTLPDITIFTPADGPEVAACVRAALEIDGPVYLRLGRNREPVLHKETISAQQIKSPQMFHQGPDGLMMCNGFILDEVLKAQSLLNEKGIDPTVIQLGTFKPFPHEELKNFFGNSQAVMTVEEHVAAGGLGQEVSHFITQNGFSNHLKTLHCPDRYLDCCMNRPQALKWAGLDAQNIAKQFVELFQNA